MDEDHKAKPEFYTKLSLPKFISLIHRLTPNQRKLVCSMGLGHLLEIKCEVLPRGMIGYLVSLFDTRARTFNLPNVPPIVVTAYFIHQVLGTPIGGRQIGEKVDAELREFIANATKCKGRYPTIKELDSRITPDLDGNLFKIIFGMYAMTAFLCPSSHDAVSPYYLHVFREPDNITSFDFSAAILDKLVSSIEAYNDDISTVLGGNLLSLLIIYLEFKDSNIVPFSLRAKWPRIGVWTTQMISDIESMDCISWDDRMYGKLPVKCVSQTPFTRYSALTEVIPNKSYEHLLQFVLSICPESHHKEVAENLPIIMGNIEKDIVESMQPILCQNIINVLKLLPSTLPSSQMNEGCKFHIVSPQFKAPLSGHTYQHTNVSSLHSDLVDSNIRSEGLAWQPMPNDNVTGSSMMTDTRCVANRDSCTGQLSQDKLPEIFTIPVPDDETLQKLDEEACINEKFPRLKSLIDSIDAIPQVSEFDIPYPHSLAASIYTQKVEIINVEALVPPVIDLLAYIVQEIGTDSRLGSLMTENLCTFDEKFEVFNDLFISPPPEPEQSQKKRAVSISTNDDAVHCIALKKRPRMLQMNEPDTSDFQMTPTHKFTVGVQYLEDGQSSKHDTNGDSTQTSSKVNSYDAIFNDKEWERQFLESTLKIEQEYYQRKLNNHPASQLQNLSNSEMSPRKLLCSFPSTTVEQDVFNDIIARVPKTAKSKTIQIVSMGSTWVEHRVLALSMQVYGRVHNYVMNMLGKAVMVEDIEKKKLGILREGHWKRYFFECKLADLFKLEYENPGKLSKLLSNGMLGFMLDTMDLIHLPMFTSGFFYLLVVNLRQRLFEVLMPNTKIHLVRDEAAVAIKNFKMSFNLAYRNSIIKMDDMETVFQCVCSTDRDGDTGVFVMKLICDYNGERTILFQPEHAKPIRESLMYYMVAHPFNEKMPPETKKILQKHNIPHDYTTPGYYPWMHEEDVSNSDDPFEAMIRF